MATPNDWSDRSEIYDVATKLQILLGGAPTSKISERKKDAFATRIEEALEPLEVNNLSSTRRAARDNLRDLAIEICKKLNK